MKKVIRSMREFKRTYFPKASEKEEAEAKPEPCPFPLINPMEIRTAKRTRYRKGN